MSITQKVNIMKKQNYSRVASVIKSIFNVRSWADYDRMKSFTSYLLNGIKKMVIPQPTVNDNVLASKKAFDDKFAEMKLTDEELSDRAKGLYRLSVVMCVAAVGIFGYTIYQLFHGGYRAVMVSFVLTAISLVLAFRYHFWYFQIKERRLGCTIREWYRQGLLGDK